MSRLGFPDSCRQLVNIPAEDSLVSWLRLEAPLNIGFVGPSEQTGHRAQKPGSVIEPLLLMTTQEGDAVLDPMCGSGTTGEACLRLNRKGILCDVSPEYLTMTQSRLEKHQDRDGQ